jgi:succinate dehydrogenase/fumarate reductase flavoprotein subunit
MSNQPIDITTDVLVIGAGAAGMMAARAASDAGSSVTLVDKSLIGRGGATIMAQMTVAVALGDAEPDSPDIHAEDTIAGSRGLADPAIVHAITDRGPELIREVERYGANWARTPDGRHSQVVAPGHSRRRCVYVDVLRSGEAVSAALRKANTHDPHIRRLNNVMVTRLVQDDNAVVGAVGFMLEQLAPVHIAARAVIVATGGLTQVYARTSASAPMTGDGMMLAAEAGAELRDMEMVQFFPIAHLYPPLVQLDPIMWDPFRYKLGGHLLNGKLDEFMDRYTGEAPGRYTATRDQTTLAIFQEVAEGRGSPHGGVYLDFRMVPLDALHEAFGPVIDILARQGIDLTRDMVEVAPMAHFMLGGIRVDPAMRTTVDRLLACGEAIYGMHGANRLSGNAMTESLVTGRIAGETAARMRREHDIALVTRAGRYEWERLATFWHPRPVDHDEIPVGALTARLQNLMWTGAGPLRTGPRLEEALAGIESLTHEAETVALGPEETFPYSKQEKVELRTMLRLSEAIVRAALARRESRGAHVRLDNPEQQEIAVSSRLLFSEPAGWSLDMVPSPLSA